MSNDYDDIINLPHYEPKHHPRMSMWNRAAQFAPFAALTGYDAAIQESNRVTDDWIDLGESDNEELNRKMELLLSKLSEQPNVTIEYFVPDEHKEGGSYQSYTGNVKRIDEYEQTMVMTDGNNIAASERLDHAIMYLVDLLRAYGKRAIIVNINQQGEEVNIVAKDFVKRQLATAGIKFPYREANKPNVRIINKHVDADMLSVIFHEALFELEDAYVKVYCEGNPKAEKYIDSIYSWIERKEVWIKCTFPPYTDAQLAPFLDTRPIEKDVDPESVKEAKEKLAELGFDKISTFEDVHKLLWELAMRREPVTKSLKEAVETLITDERVLAWFQEIAHSYNCYVHVRHTDEIFRKEESVIKKLKGELTTAQTNFKVLQGNSKQEKLQAESMSRKLAKKLMNQLKTHNTRFQNSYDFTREEDITEFLSWYKIVKRPVNKKTIKDICKRRCPDSESQEMFMRMVEEHNAQFVSNASDDD